MVAEPRSVGAADQRLEPLEMFGIGRSHRPEVHRHAMLHNTVLLQNPIEHGQRPARVAHEVFRDDLEPVDDRLAREDVVVVGNAQADSDTVILIRIEAIAGHGIRSQFLVAWVESLVLKGHDLSRAACAAKSTRALAPEGMCLANTQIRTA